MIKYLVIPRINVLFQSVSLITTGYATHVSEIRKGFQKT